MTGIDRGTAVRVAGYMLVVGALFGFGVGYVLGRYGW